MLAVLLSRLPARAGDFSLAALIVVADQVTKMLVRARIPLGSSTTVVPGFVDFTHVQNTGAAFGILNLVEFPFKASLLIGVALVALVGIGFYAAHLPSRQYLARVGLALILGGAIGNLIDRIRNGYVLDFVDAYWRDHHFWAFNVADAAITVGVTAIILDLLLEHGPSRSR